MKIEAIVLQYDIYIFIKRMSISMIFIEKRYNLYYECVMMKKDRREGLNKKLSYIVVAI